MKKHGDLDLRDERPTSRSVLQISRSVKVSLKSRWGKFEVSSAEGGIVETAIAGGVVAAAAAAVAVGLTAGAVAAGCGTTVALVVLAAGFVGVAVGIGFAVARRHRRRH